MSTDSGIASKLHQHPYTAYYCEENVYHLVQWLKSQKQSAQVFAVFVTNDARQNLLFYQKASTPERQYVVWDYHVFAVVVEGGTATVWDLDSQLGLAVPFDEYVAETFRPHLYKPGGVVQTLTELEPPCFRIVDAANFLAYFASDRSHMLLPDTETYCYPPPTLQCICGPASAIHGTTNNLWTRYLDVRESSAGVVPQQDWQPWEASGAIYGDVFNLDQFEKRRFIHASSSDTPAQVSAA